MTGAATRRPGRPRPQRSSLSRARGASRLPPTVDVGLLQQLLTGAILNHSSAYPDTTTADEIAVYLAAVLEMVGGRAPWARTAVTSPRSGRCRRRCSRS
jgi:hypothetical protein